MPPPPCGDMQIIFFGQSTKPYDGLVYWGNVTSDGACVVSCREWLLSYSIFHAAPIPAAYRRRPISTVFVGFLLAGSFEKDAMFDHNAFTHDGPDGCSVENTESSTIM